MTDLIGPLLADHPFTAALVPTTGSDLRVVAVTDSGLGNTSWLVDLGHREALVVDPERDPSPYRAVAERLGTTITLAADTHLHADFVTGSPELAAAGADVVAARAGEVQWPHHGVTPGDAVDLGTWRLQVLATPGHTPEHVAYVLADADRPRAVFSGGSLLVGAVARTDLIDPADTDALTRALWHSVRHELMGLPDDVAVFPTHGAGSFCSAAGDHRRWTTIGQERRTNPLLAAPDEDTFVRWVLDQLGTYPPYFLRLRAVNRLGPRVFGAFPTLPPLDPGRVEDLRAQGAVVVDVRPVTEFAAGHVAGSLVITLRPQFSSWLGWMVPDPATPLVFVTDQHTDRAELVRQCLNIGYEHLAGELSGGLAGWAAAGGALGSVAHLDAAHLAAAGSSGRTVIDVRQVAEYDDGHVPGAVHVELGSLSERASNLPATPLIMMCGHGERAATGASVLAATGRTDVAVFEGGPAAWAAVSGVPLVRS